MSILWFLLGLVLACAYIWLQWQQVKDITPNSSVPRKRFALSYFVRLVLFAVIIGFALQRSLASGLVVFAGFWIARTILLIFIGSDFFGKFARRVS